MMPGAVVRCDGKRMVMTGQQNNGTRYFLNHAEKSVDYKTVEVILHNDGLVYL